MPYKDILERKAKFDPYFAQDEAKELAAKISTMVNVMGESGLAEVAILIIQDHRTLQQGLMREFIWPLLRLWAEDYNRGTYDDRNEDTVRLAFNIVSTFNNQAHFRFI